MFSLKKQNLGIIRVKTNAESLKKMKTNLYRYFLKILGNIKQALLNIMNNSRKTSIKKDLTKTSDSVEFISHVTALNRGTSLYLTNLLGMFDVFTQQEIAKVKPYKYQGN